MRISLEDTRDPIILKKLAAHLVEKEFVTQEEMDESIVAAEKAGVPVGHYLLQEGLVTRRQLYDGVPREERPEYWDLVAHPPTSEALKLFTPTFVRKYMVMPVKLIKNSGGKEELLLAMSDPRNIGIIDAAAMVSSHKITPVYSPQEEITNCIAESYNTAQEAAKTLSEKVQKAQADTLLEEDLKEKGIVVSGNSPVEMLVDELLARAVAARASDMHVEPSECSIRVRYRIDGVLREEMRISKENQSRVISRLKLMAGIDIAESRKPQDGSYSKKINGAAYDFRVSTLPGVYGEHVVYRILRKDQALLKLADLGFSSYALHHFEESYRKPWGTILVTGPTGSGKTTTLYSLINEINTVGKNIITAENPVEYRIEGITQCNINPKAGLTFASALRSFLRSDPDVILVGEIRDTETAEIAMEAALTGHLVLSTLHTNDSAIAIPRLREIGVPSFVVASALDCIVAQRLARKLCPYCKIEEHPREMELLAAGLDTKYLGHTFYTAGHCNHCGGTGYQGRIAICEIMPVTEKIRELTITSASADTIRNAAIEAGMVTLRQDALNRVVDGTISIAEAVRVTV